MTLLLLTSACVVSTDKPGDDTAEPQVVSRLLMEGAFELGLARESLCALDEAGALHCWGPDASQFEALPDGTGHTDLTVVEGGGCVLSEGVVDCWDGVPEPTENEGFTQASVAGAACGVRANDILCWDGFNDDTTPWAGALQVAMVVPFATNRRISTNSTCASWPHLRPTGSTSKLCSTSFLCAALALPPSFCA